jgi:hypothetical protein
MEGRSGFYGQSELSSSLIVRSEHSIPATVIEDHEIFLCNLRRIRMMK